MPSTFRPRSPAARHPALLLGLIAAAAQELAAAQAAAPRPAPPVHQAVAAASAKAGAKPSASGSAAIDLLVQQGRHWQAGGKPDLAEQAWRKVLASNPQHPEALYGMAASKIAANQPAAAQPYIDQLRRLPAGAAFLARLDQDRQLAGKGDLLKKARQLAKDGKPDEAVEAYKAALGNAKPSGPVAVEYYQTLGNTLDGGEDAAKGLARLAAESPNDRHLALLAAQQLTYTDSTRREGIKRLAGMVDLPDVGREADASWQKALGWMAAVPSTMPYLKEYLQRHPDDKSLRATLADLERGVADGAFQQIEPDPAITRAQQGFAALKAGKLDAAENAFQASLRLRPNQPRAVGGLGLVRLRQKRFAEASELLEKAKQGGKPGEGRQWEGALQSARYWSVFERAEAAGKAGDTAEAERLLAQARAIDPGEHSGDFMLADLHAGQRDYAAAASDFRGILAQHPDDPNALKGLASALENGGRHDELQAFVDGLSPEQQQAMGDLGPLRGRLLGATARAQLDKGDKAAARRSFAQALQADPADPWNRLALAQLLDKGGDAAQATAVMSAQPPVPADAPALLAATLHAHALFDAQRDNWHAVRAGLERIPAADRSAPMLALLQTATVHDMLVAAADSAARGRPADAAGLRSRAAAAAGDKPDLLLAVATAEARAGGADGVRQAQTLYARATAADPAFQPGLQLAYAAALYKSGSDDGTALARLAALDLSAEQRQGVDGLRKASALRQAEALRARRDFNGAQQALAPALRQYPDDVQLLAAQARILGGTQRHGEALAVYRRALGNHPGDAMLLMGAAREARAQHDDVATQKYLDGAVAAAPGDARVLIEVARYYQDKGRTQRAEQLLSQAMSADARRNGQTSYAPEAGTGDEGGGADDPEGDGGFALSAPLGPAVAEPLPRAVQVAQTDVPAPQDQPQPLTPEERSAAQKDLDRLRAERSPEISTGIVVRSRSGQDGLSHLVDTEAPTSMRWTQGDARLGVTVTPTHLGSGLPDLPSAGSQFGSGAAAGVAPTQSAGNQHDSGVGVSGSYERDGLKADVGTTPIGFQHVDAVGGVKLTRNIDPAWSWSGELSRRAVTDSLLSFAGARDSRTGLEWGGVTATGGRLQLGWDQQTWGLYGYGSLHELRGEGVAHNNRQEIGGGLYRHLWRDDNGQLTTGVNVSTLSYDQNLRYFTQGQGGYFSPQRFTSVSIPIDWSQRSGNFAWRARGSLGLQRFREDATPFFPTNPVAQAASGNAFYAGQSRHGVGYGAALAMEYRATPRMSVGAQAAVDNSRDYRQLSAGVYVKVNFEPAAGSPPPLPLMPVQSPYGGQ